MKTKNMFKKRKLNINPLGFIIMFIILGFVLSSCNKKDDVDPEPEPDPRIEEFLSKLEGDWELKYLSVDHNNDGYILLYDLDNSINNYENPLHVTYRRYFNDRSFYIFEEDERVNGLENYHGIDIQYKINTTNPFNTHFTYYPDENKINNMSVVIEQNILTIYRQTNTYLLKTELKRK